MFTDDIFNWIEEKIKQYPAKYYGISVMNGTFIWGITIAKIIKKIEPEISVVRYKYKDIIFVYEP